MRAEDIVEAIQAKLPLSVDDFTDQVNIAAITVDTAWDGSITILQVETSTAHGLANNKAVYLSNIFNPTDISSFTRNGIVGTIVTTQVHDLTTGSQTSVTVQDANEATFNGTFTLLNVTNRNTFTVLMTDAGDTVGTGSMISLNIGGVNKNIGGLRAVSSANSTTTFLYEIGIEVTQPINDGGIVKGQPRITAAISLDRFIEDSYTKQADGEGWLCVVVGDSVANKSRRQDIDSTDNIQRTQYFNQKFAQAADVYVVFPAVQTIAGRSVRDRCEELLQPICQCILFKKFDSLMTAGLFNPLQFTGAGFEQYTKAYYAHRYSFEMTIQMGFADTVGYDDDVAFRDIVNTISVSTGTNELIDILNLDEDAES